MKGLIVLCCCVFWCLNGTPPQNGEGKTIKLNTSNPGKFAEFKRLFAAYGYELEMSHIDLDEVDADPITVVAQKASQVEEGVVVEDTSLEIEGASVGVNVRWLLDHLPDYAGRRAHWVVLLAHRSGDKILIYEGKVSGAIVKERGGEGFGFDPVFLPDGATETLAQSKPDRFNARAKAVEALIKNNVFAEHAPIEEWDGPWQQD